MRFTPAIALAIIAFCSTQAAPLAKTPKFETGVSGLASEIPEPQQVDIISTHGVYRRADIPVNDGDDDPEMSERVRLDEYINEIYRQAQVAELKEKNTSMKLRVEDFEKITHEMQLFGVSVSEKEFCDKVMHHVEALELSVDAKEFEEMCKAKHQQLNKALEDEEREFQEAEKKIDDFNGNAVKNALHWVTQQKNHDEHHDSFNKLEHDRWVDKQVQRAKHNAAVKAGTKDGLIARDESFLHDFAGVDLPGAKESLFKYIDDALAKLNEKKEALDQIKESFPEQIGQEIPVISERGEIPPHTTPLRNSTSWSSIEPAVKQGVNTR